MNPRQTRHEELCRMAAKAVAGHEIMKTGEGRWRLMGRDAAGRPTQCHCAEVVVLWGGKLLVHGDVELVCFDRRVGGTDDEVVAWIGAHQEPDDYVAGKAVIGTGDARVYVCDDDVFAFDLRAWLGDADDRDRALADEVIEDLELDGDVEGARRRLFNDLTDVDTEAFVGFGLVVAPRVYYAHAAVRRLWTLLQATS